MIRTYKDETRLVCDLLWLAKYEIKAPIVIHYTLHINPLLITSHFRTIPIAHTFKYVPLLNCYNVVAIAMTDSDVDYLRLLKDTLIYRV